MTFLNPAGLWLLLGVPLLIILYIIKAQYEDQPVSSTYIWKLSHRFMKKSKPMQKMRKVLLFLLQLLLIVAIAMITAKPAWQSGASCDYIAIIDASAGMQTTDEKGISRFDKAIKEVEELTGKITYGHTVSVILASDSPSILAQKSVSQYDVKRVLGNISCTNGECNTTEALSLAQLIADESRNPQVLFYTDCAYEAGENLTVINLSSGEHNIAIEALEGEIDDQTTVFTGSVTSYHQDASVTVGLKVDGRTVDAQIVHCMANQPVQVVFTAEGIGSFSEAELYTEAKDSLAIDNSYTLCRKANESYDVLLISQSPFYLQSVLKALGNCDVTVRSSPDALALADYDLYIFDGVAPAEYPTDGSVLLFGTDNLPDGLKSGAAESEPASLSMSNLLESELFEDLTLADTAVINYTPLTVSQYWESLLFCDEEAVLTTRELDTGMKFTVVSFDVHDSNLPMQSDFVILMRNLVEYSVPALLKDTDHAAGETINLTVLPGAEQLCVRLPDGTQRYLSAEAGQVSFLCEEVGVHTAILTSDKGTEHVDFFVHIPTGESVAEKDLTLGVAIDESTNTAEKTALSGIWHWIAGITLLLLLLEWGWYYREQY